MAKSSLGLHRLGLCRKSSSFLKKPVMCFISKRHMFQAHVLAFWDIPDYTFLYSESNVFFNPKTAKPSCSGSFWRAAKHRCCLSQLTVQTEVLHGGSKVPSYRWLKSVAQFSFCEMYAVYIHNWLIQFNSVLLNAHGDCRVNPQEESMKVT